MENDVIDALQDLGYIGPILEDGGFDKALEGSTKSPEFRGAVVWLASELRIFCKLDEEVNEVSSLEDVSSFILELSSFLKEMGCQYKFLTEGHMSERFQSKRHALLLLHYLVTELQAARMVVVKNLTGSPSMEIKLQETSTASELQRLLIALKFPKPPDNIQPSQLFEKVEQRLKDVVSRTPPDLLNKPLFTGVLTDKQWCTLASIQKDLHEEYRLRREMLIKRVDVTIQSFQWSDRVKHKTEEISNAMATKRIAMLSMPNVRLSDLLAARADLAIIEKTSSASVRRNTQTQLNKVIIGQVPDRGGRTTDQAPPPPEMPSWQKDRSAGGGGRGGGGRGGGGGGRGGYNGGNRGGYDGGNRGGHGGGNRGGYGGGERNRVQGGWNQGRNERNQGGWNRGGNRDDRQSFSPDHDDRDRRTGGWQQGDRRGGGGGGYKDQRDHNQGDYYGERNHNTGRGRRDNNYR